MEERWSIRELLLMTFTSMSALDSTVISVLLNSVLPMELARLVVVSTHILVSRGFESGIYSLYSVVC